MSVLDKVRKWIDGETAELVLEEAARDAQVKPRSRSEEFIVKIARAIEGVMQAEMLPLPQGTAIIPTEYTIFLSESDDKEWQGAKRRGLEQGLYHILAERAREIAGRKKLETRSFVIELRIDGTLEPGDIRIQHSWEDTSSNKTGVLARPGSSQPQKPVQSQPAKPSAPPYTPPSFQQQPKFTSPAVEMPAAHVAQQQPAKPRVVSQDAEVMTNVRPRVQELYRLEIWLNGVRQNVVPVYNTQITVGRGSRSKPVDISLSGDAEISRRHLVLITDGAWNFWAVNEGRNPAMIATYELPVGQRVPLAPGASLNICSYMLRIQPKMPVST